MIWRAWAGVGAGQLGCQGGPPAAAGERPHISMTQAHAARLSHVEELGAAEPGPAAHALREGREEVRGVRRAGAAAAAPRCLRASAQRSGQRRPALLCAASRLALNCSHWLTANRTSRMSRMMKIAHTNPGGSPLDTACRRRAGAEAVGYHVVAASASSRRAILGWRSDAARCRGGRPRRMAQAAAAGPGHAAQSASAGSHPSCFHLPERKSTPKAAWPWRTGSTRTRTASSRPRQRQSPWRTRRRPAARRWRRQCRG